VLDVDEPTRSTKISPGVILAATIGLLLIALPGVTTGRTGLVAIGAVSGMVITLFILRLGYVNRGNTARTRRGTPAWGAGIGVFVAAIAISLDDVGGGDPALAFAGGILLTYVVASVVLPPLLRGDRQSRSQPREQ
jgi:hypothetical protein